MLHHWSDYLRSAVGLVAILQLYFPNVSSFGNFISGEKKKENSADIKWDINTETFGIQLQIERNR